MLSDTAPDKDFGLATFSINIAMIENLVSAIKKCGCAHFFYFSSDAI